MLAAASVTDSLVTLATNVIQHLGLAGTALLNLTSGVIAVPGTEATMLFSGFDVVQGHLTLLGIIVAGVIGDLAGATIAYAIGRFATDLLERHGSKVHMAPERLELAHRWFGRYGAPVVFVSRLIPLVRAVFPYAAGVAEMSYVRFIAFAAGGSILWIGGLGILGREVGSNWTHWRHNLEYVDYLAVVLLIGAVVFLALRRNRGRRDPAAEIVSE